MPASRADMRRGSRAPAIWPMLFMGRFIRFLCSCPSGEHYIGTLWLSSVATEARNEEAIEGAIVRPEIRARAQPTLGRQQFRWDQV